jgi:hypothetical protein
MLADVGGEFVKRAWIPAVAQVKRACKPRLSFRRSEAASNRDVVQLSVLAEREYSVHFLDLVWAVCRRVVPSLDVYLGRNLITDW